MEKHLKWKIERLPARPQSSAKRIGGQEMDAERANGWVSSMSDRVAAEADLDGDGVLGEREVLFAEHLVALALNHAMYDHPADDDEFLDSRYQVGKLWGGAGPLGDKK